MTVERAKRALAVTFVVNGLAFASFASRAPAVKDRLHLSSPQLGLLLLAFSGGAVAALPVSGPLVHRFGAKRMLLFGACCLAAGFWLVAAGLRARSVPLAAPGLAVVGAGNGFWDVAMNVEGVEVERRLGRSVLPRLHAGYSLGTVGGALLGAVCAAAHVGVPGQVGVVAAVVLAAVAVATRDFLVASGVPEVVAAVPVRPWREVATLLLGVMTLSFALAEGIANDWLALATRAAHGTSDAVAALVYGCFVATMTLARTFGGAAIGRRGRVPVLRLSALLGLAGVLLASLGPVLAVGVVGALLWGVGASLGFPVGMLAAADEPAGAALRLSVVSSIAYAAFLGGPPLIGALGGWFGLPHAILVAGVAFLVGIVLAGRAREPQP